MSRLPKVVIPVGQLPNRLQLLLADHTSDDATDVVGVQLALRVVRFRKRVGRGPTFSELFDPLLAETKVAGERVGDSWILWSREDIYSLRHHLAVHFRRHDWINWTRLPRSLRPGPMFRKPQPKPREIHSDDALAETV